jgi:uncharacterized membrane protein
MTQNPFEAPRVQEHHQPSLAAGTFDLGKAINDSWRAVSRDMAMVVGATLLGLLVFVAGYITVVGIFFVLPALTWGGIKFLLEVHDGRGDFSTIFEGFKDYWSRTGSILLLGVLFTVPLIPGYGIMFAGVATDSVAPMLIGELLIIVLVFTIMLRMYFAIFFIVDQGMPAVDAVKASWEVTRHQKLNTFLLMLVSQIIGSLGMLACGFGLLVTAPMSYLMFASAYRQLTGTAR